MTERVNTKRLKETVIEVKVMPMGESPKNRPSSPVSPKLNATDRTSSSRRSILFLPVNNMLTRQ